MRDDKLFSSHSHIVSSHSSHSLFREALTKLCAIITYGFILKKLFKTTTRNNVSKANYVFYVPSLCDYVAKKTIAILIISSLSLSLYSQESKEKNWTLQGYTKSPGLLKQGLELGFSLANLLEINPILKPV